MLQSLSNAWHKSWAKHWGVAKLATGGLALGTHYIGQVVNNSDVKAAIDALHIDPKLMLGLAVLGAVTIVSAEH